MSDAAALVLSLQERARSFAADQEGASLVGALDAASSALSRPPERPRAAEEALRAAAGSALSMGWAKPVALDWILDLGRALSACIAAQERTPRLFFVAPAENPAPPLASRGRPAFWAPVVSFAPTSPEEMPAPPQEKPSESTVERKPGELAPVDRLEPANAEKNLVVVAPKVGLPIPAAAVRARRVARCLDSMAMHARHRHLRAFARAAEEEERLLSYLDAARIQGAALPGAMRAWWAEAKKAPDPFRIFAPMLVLGSFVGDDGLAAVEEVLAALPEDDADAARIAAEALALSGHPRLLALAEHLSRAPHPLARAAGLELSYRLNVLDPAVLSEALFDSNVPVAIAAARASSSALMQPVIPRAVKLLGHPHPRVAWEVSRSLTLLGRPEPIEHARHVPAFAEKLGARLVPLIGMAGGPDDEALLRLAVKRMPATAESLHAVARFGHPRTWFYLSHFLGDDDLADAAADALEELFGPLVAEEERTRAAAWRAAITARAFDPQTRLWRGKPWHPSRFHEEMQAARASRLRLEARADELRSRLGLDVGLDLFPWSAEQAMIVRTFLSAMDARKDVCHAGTWTALGVEV